MKKEQIFLFFVFGLGLVLLVMFFGHKKLLKKSAGKNGVSQIKIEDGDNMVTINDNGAVEFRTPKRVFYQTWDKDKIQDIFQYFDQKRGSSLLEGEGYKVSFFSGDERQELYIDNSDQQISSLFDVFSNFGDDKTSISDYFNFEAGGSSGESAGGSSGGDSGSSGGSGSGGGSSGGHSDCPFWLLSYCVYPRSPAPSSGPSPLPSPTSSPGQSSNKYVVKECTLWDELINERTVISNDVCISEGD